MRCLVMLFRRQKVHSIVKKNSHSLDRKPKIKACAVGRSLGCATSHLYAPHACGACSFLVNFTIVAGTSTTPLMEY